MFRSFTVALTSGFVAACLGAPVTQGSHLGRKVEPPLTVDEEKETKAVVHAHFDALRVGNMRKLRGLWDLQNGMYVTSMIGNHVLSNMRAADWIAVTAAGTHPHYNAETLKLTSFKLVSPREATVEVSFSMQKSRPTNQITFQLKKIGSSWRIVKVVDHYLSFGC